jgi:hypothetical protein
MHRNFTAIQQNHQNSILFHETIPLKLYWPFLHISHACSSLESLHELNGSLGALWENSLNRSIGPLHFYALTVSNTVHTVHIVH